MSKKTINDFLSIAYQGITKSALYDRKKGELKGNCKAQITSFGAAVKMGSLLSAIAFFSNQNKSEVNRIELMKLIYYVIKKGEVDFEEIEKNKLFIYAQENNKIQEEILDAAIAIKLAFNLFEKETSTNNKGDK